MLRKQPWILIYHVILIKQGPPERAAMVRAAKKAHRAAIFRQVDKANPDIDHSRPLESSMWKVLMPGRCLATRRDGRFNQYLIIKKTYRTTMKKLRGNARQRRRVGNRPHYLVDFPDTEIITENTMIMCELRITTAST